MHFVFWTGLYAQHHTARTAETMGIPTLLQPLAQTDRLLSSALKHGFGGIGTLAFAGIDRAFGLRALDNYHTSLERKKSHVEALKYALEKEWDGYSKLHGEMTGAVNTLTGNHLETAHKRWEKDVEKDMLHPEFYAALQRNNAARHLRGPASLPRGSSSNTILTDPSHLKPQARPHPTFKPMRSQSLKSQKAIEQHKAKRAW